jgi:formate dehydrogenase maturation protein FdhE
MLMGTMSDDEVVAAQAAAEELVTEAEYGRQWESPQAQREVLVSALAEDLVSARIYDDQVAAQVSGGRILSAAPWNACPACASTLTGPLHSSPDGHGTKYFRCTTCRHQWAS